MGRILAIDYGSKRVGLAVTDPSRIIATALDTVHSSEAINYLKKYLLKETVDAFVVGDPMNLDGSASQSAPLVKGFVTQLKKAFPDMPIHFVDERFTSKMASQTLVAGGYKKKTAERKKI